MKIEIKKPTLIDLVIQSNFIMQSIVENNGELPPDLESQLTNIDLQISTKIDGYNFIMDRLESESNYWKQKSDDYLRIAKTCKAARENMRERIKLAMIQLDKNEICGQDTRFKLSDSKAALLIDQEKLPISYKMQVTELVPDKEKILKELNEGFSVEGAELKPTKSLRVYTNTKR